MYDFREGDWLMAIFFTCKIEYGMLTE